MTTNKSSSSSRVQNFAIAILALGLIGTNVFWYQMYQGVDLSLSNGAQAWVYSQSQIGKLKNCVDNGTKPCDITPQSSPSSSH
jgi:hypothetical protein